MPYQPSNSQVHIDRPLTNISIAYVQDAMQFVSGRAAPTISVQKRSDSYFIYNKGDFFRDEMKLRAPATESAGSGWNLTTATYNADVWALHKDIPDLIRDNADQPLNFEADATRFLTQKALIRRDKIFSTTFMGTGIWTAAGSDGTPTPKWDAANSTPIAQIRAGITAVHAGTGYRPNSIVMGQKVWDVVSDNADFLNRVNQGQTTGPAIVQAATLARILELEQVLVMGGVETTSQEGAADVSTFIGGLDTGVLIHYVSRSPGLMMPSSMYTFAWTGYLGANAEGGVIRRMRMDTLAADRVELEMSFDMKLIASDMGYFITDVLT